MMIRLLVTAGTEYFVDRGVLWNASRLSACIAIATGTFLNFLTCVCIYYVTRGKFPEFLSDVGKASYVLLVALLTFVIWSASSTVTADSIKGDVRARVVRRRVWLGYFISTVVIFAISGLLVLARMN